MGRLYESGDVLNLESTFGTEQFGSKYNNRAR